MSYSAPGGADVWCVKVTLLVSGPGDVAMAWVEDTSDTRRVLRVPLRELKPGCATPAASAAR